MFIGIATRQSRRGDKTACSHVGALWADVDLHGRALADVIAQLEATRPRPTMLVASGGGVHCYWRIRPAAEAHPVARIEGHLRGLRALVDGDPAATDVCRVLRLPGTFNHKSEYVAEFGRPLPVRLLRCADE